MPKYSLSKVLRQANVDTGIQRSGKNAQRAGAAGSSSSRLATVFTNGLFRTEGSVRTNATTGE